MAIKRDPKLSVFRVGEARVPCADLILNIEPCPRLITYPTAVNCYLEIDNHIHQGRDFAKYNAVDKIFVTQKNFLGLYPKEKTTWLPLAADPELHKLQPNEPTLYDVGFLGNTNYPERNTLLNQIAQKYKLLCSNAEPGIPYSKLLSQCKVLFNRSMDNDMNMRFFEAMSIGRPLVSDVVPGQDDLFDGESDYISYEKWEDLDTKIQFLLDHPEYAKKIGEQGAAHIRAEHTYQHRLEKILQVCGFY